MGDVHSAPIEPTVAPTVISVFQLVPYHTTTDAQRSLLLSYFVGTIPYSHAPELALINGFFHNRIDSDGKHRIVEYVPYSDQPRGVLLIVETISSPIRKHAYLCESAEGRTPSMTSEAHPLITTKYDHRAMLDVANLPIPALHTPLANFMEKRDDTDWTTCASCYGRIATTWFPSCEHLVACEECARSLDQCRRCSSLITERVLLPLFLRTSSRIPTSTVEPFAMELKKVRYRPGWILSDEQLLDIGHEQQSRSKQVLSRTAHHVMESVRAKLLYNRDSVHIYEHVPDFMTDVVVIDEEENIFSIVNTSAYQAIKKYPQNEYRLQGDPELVIAQIQHHVRVDLLNRGCFD